MLPITNYLFPQIYTIFTTNLSQVYGLLSLSCCFGWLSKCRDRIRQKHTPSPYNSLFYLFIGVVESSISRGEQCTQKFGICPSTALRVTFYGIFLVLTFLALMGVEIFWLGWLFWAGRKERLKEAPLRPSPKSHPRRRL